VLPLAFTAVTDTTESVIFEGSINGTQVLYREIRGIDDLIVARAYREEDKTIVVGNLTLHSESGCFGEYLITIEGSVAEQCNAELNPYNDCQFAVQTSNCAFVKSEPLIITSLAVDEETTLTAEALLLLRERYSRASEKSEATFYSLFKIVGMAALLECFFTLFGVILKWTAKVARTSGFYRKRTTVVQDGNVVAANEEVLSRVDVDSPGTSNQIVHEDVEHEQHTNEPANRTN
jgi:hypothetical protein